MVRKENNNLDRVFMDDGVTSTGLYTFKFLIRGKPWLLSIDDQTPYDNSGGVPPLYADGSSLIWVPLLEKAWAKVKGTYKQYENYPSH